MTIQEVKNEVGKKQFLADGNTLAGKLIYISGIDNFDEYLGDKDQNELRSVIHFDEYPHGIVIKLVQNFSSKEIALNYNRIKSVDFIKSLKYSVIKVNVENKQFYFGFDNDDNLEVINFFKKLKRLTFNENSKYEVPKEVKTKIETYWIKHTDVMPINVTSLIASKGKRLLNFLIDTTIIIFLNFLFLDKQLDYTQATLLGSFTSLFYYGTMEGAFRITIGKLITNTKVVSSDGSKADDIAIRTLCRYIPFEAFSFLGKGQGWHDSISKTIVIDKALRKKTATNKSIAASGADTAQHQQ